MHNARARALTKVPLTSRVPAERNLRRGNRDGCARPFETGGQILRNASRAVTRSMDDVVHLACVFVQRLYRKSSKQDTFRNRNPKLGARSDDLISSSRDSSSELTIDEDAFVNHGVAVALFSRDGA